MDEILNLIKGRKWIGYPEVNKLHSKMNDLMQDNTIHRKPNLLLVGESNNGKTMALKKYIELNKPYLDEEKKLVIPVLFVEAPPEPVEKRFYDAILSSLNAPFKPNEKVENKYYRIKHILSEARVKVMIIDEIHNILVGSANKQRVFLNVIKHLSNELKISMVCSGTKDAFNAFNTDPQLSNRFEPFVLGKWKFNNDYLRLLKSFEALLPHLNLSSITKNVAAEKILYKSDGLIGEISKIFELSAIYVYQNKLHDFTEEILEKINYNSPSERKKLLRSV